eukprot:g4911.t1
MTFVVHAKDRFGNPAEIATDTVEASTMMTSPTQSGAVPCTVSSAAAGLYNVEYTLAKVGTYSLSVKVNGAHIQNGASPFTVLVTPGATVASNSIAFGSGFTDGLTVSDRPQTVFLQARDQFNNNRTVSGEAFTMTYQRQVPATSEYQGNITFDAGLGRYRCEFVVKLAGTWTLIIKHGGALIADGSRTVEFVADVASPYHSRAQALRSASMSWDAREAVPAYFQLEARDKYGNRVLDSKLTLPTANLVSQTLSSASSTTTSASRPESDDITAESKYVGDGKYEFTYTPTWAGSYLLSVRVNSLEVYDSPFPVLVRPFTCAAANASRPYRCTTNKGPLCEPGTNFCCVEDYDQCEYDAPCLPEGSSCASGIQCQPGATLCDDALTCVPEGLVGTGCPNMTDVATAVTCPPLTPLRCSDGETCVADTASCPSGGTCGKSEVKCPDLSCATSVDKCPVTEACLKEPFTHRCSAGSCVTKPSECPTRVTCPVGTVLCQSDQSCRYSVDNCPTACRDQSADSGSAGACPPMTSYDVCTGSISGDVRCPAGACRTAMANCPSHLICPPETPFRCADSSCAASVFQCGAVSNCPEGQRLCPDGSCTRSNCGSPLTCTRTHPVKCGDGSCRRSTEDCPVQKDCPESAPFRCSNGVCVEKRVRCKGMDECRRSLKTLEAKDVLCPDGDVTNCVSTVDECEAREVASPGKFDACPTGAPHRCCGGECSQEKVMCMDGTCRSSSSQCPVGSTCPPGLYRCRSQPFGSGQCVKNLQDCRSWGPFGAQDYGGCPQSHPFKCTKAGHGGTGLCRKSAADPCDVEGTFKASTSGDINCALANPLKPVRCPNSGDCVTSASDCKASNNCPLDRPVRCGNGDCEAAVAGCAGKTNCADATPYRCADRSCAATPLACVSTEGCPGSSPVRCAGDDSDGTGGTDGADKAGHTGGPLDAFDALDTLDANQRHQQFGWWRQPSTRHERDPVRQTRMSIDDMRKDDVGGGNNYLTFERAVVSTVVELELPVVAQPLRYPLQATFATDLAKATFTADVGSVKCKSSGDCEYCLGRMTTDATGSIVWVCEEGSSARPATTSRAMVNAISATITRPGVYAIVYHPNPLPPPVVEKSFWEKYMVYILSISGGLLLVFLVIGYVLWRLHRYKMKWKAAKKLF